MEIITKSPLETKDLGREIGSSLKGGEIISLTGELGAGKTTFVQGLAKGLGIEKTITSPTFIIMRKYEAPNDKFLYHVDLYRLEENVDREIVELGLADLWGKGKNIFVVEWAEKIGRLPSGAKKITILQSGESRIINIA